LGTVRLRVMWYVKHVVCRLLGGDVEVADFASLPPTDGVSFCFGSGANSSVGRLISKTNIQ
jgi:hypothetical protein